MRIEGGGEGCEKREQAVSTVVTAVSVGRRGRTHVVRWRRGPEASLSPSPSRSFAQQWLVTSRAACRNGKASLKASRKVMGGSLQ